MTVGQILNEADLEWGEKQMKKFWIDFSGYCCIEAETRDEAEEKFWQGLRSPSKNVFNDVYEIEGIEETE